MLLIVVDQVIKYVVDVFLKPVGNLAVIDGLLNFTYVENRGAAFGMLQNFRWIFIVLTIVIIVVCLYMVVSKAIDNRLLLYSLIFIIGGGAGNLIDRIFRGYVIDYINVSFFPPVFNFADCCVTIGAILLIVYLFTSPSQGETKDLDGNSGYAERNIDNS